MSGQGIQLQSGDVMASSKPSGGAKAALGRFWNAIQPGTSRNMAAAKAREKAEPERRVYFNSAPPCVSIGHVNRV